jgi:hypothetical protein
VPGSRLPATHRPRLVDDLADGFEMGETNPDLMWPKSIEVFDKMRREDGQVGSSSARSRCRSAARLGQIDPRRPRRGRRVRRDRPRPADQGSGRRKRPCAPGPVLVQEHLRLALLELVYGHSFFEQVYRPEGDPAHLGKLAWRPPRTISRDRRRRRRRPGRDQQYSPARLKNDVRSRSTGSSPT